MYENNVFLNCPLDAAYQPLLEALVFAIHDCGFRARCALEAEDSGEERIRKIKRIIRECRFGVHDISRVQLDQADHLPRFNMPLELGLFLGAQEFGSGAQKQKRSLVLDSAPFRYQKFCSDIAGQDIRAHNDDPGLAMAAVRGMLSTALDGAARLPGAAAIRARYDAFRADLPRICGRLQMTASELQFTELRSFVVHWLAEHPFAAQPAAVMM